MGQVRLGPGDIIGKDLNCREPNNFTPVRFHDGNKLCCRTIYASMYCINGQLVIIDRDISLGTDRTFLLLPCALPPTLPSNPLLLT